MSADTTGRIASGEIRLYSFFATDLMDMKLVEDLKSALEKSILLASGYCNFNKETDHFVHFPDVLSTNKFTMDTS